MRSATALREKKVPRTRRLRRAHRVLTLLRNDVKEIVTAARVSTERSWFPPPWSGRYPASIDVLDELFEFKNHDVIRTDVFQILDEALRVYREDADHARKRTLSPFWWLRRGLAWTRRIVLHALRVVGVDTRLLSRRASRAYGQFVRLALLVATLLGILVSLRILGWV